MLYMNNTSAAIDTSELKDIKIEYSKGKKKKIILIVSLSIALFIASIVAITLGASSVNFNTVFQVFGDLFVHNDAITETQRQIVLGIRLPRVLAAILAGIALSNAGLLMQGVFQNPLVSPYTLGVSNGASFGAALAIVFSSHFAFLNLGTYLLPVFAFISSVLTMILVYGIAKMLNFAHGDVIMVGAFITYTMCSTMGLSPVIGVLAAVIACTLLGMAIEKVAYKPLRKASSPLAVLITAIGVSYLLQNVALLIFGANAKAFTSVVSVPAVKLADGQINITGETIVTIVTCLIIMAGLMLFINKTKAGQAMLAVSEDKGAAQLMGINVDGTIALTFAIGSGLAAVAGVLLCSAYPSLTPYTGSMPGIKGFTAAVFGGIGSIPGALIGGILLGIIEILGRAYISSQLSDAIVFAVLIVVLLVKPTGILGKQIHEKV